MIQTEFYRARKDGVKLYRTFSDAGMKIRKDGTDKVYTSAIDVEDSGLTYSETDIPIEGDRNATENEGDTDV